MTRTVFCRKYRMELPGLEKPPVPGKLGEDIFEHVSEKAWREWQAHQTTLINEKQLRLIDPEARKYLREQMDRFFENREVEKAEGFVPKKP